MKLTLRTTKREASDIFSFIFTPERPLRWRAGQYLHYILNHPQPGDRAAMPFPAGRSINLFQRGLQRQLKIPAWCLGTGEDQIEQALPSW